MATTYNPETADPGVIQKIPAGDLLIDPNIRTSIRLDKSFVSSIRVYGFEQYPVGYQDEDGKTHVTIGQRRVSAALEIGWPVIPIVIKPQNEAEADRADELRILTQLAENEQRTPLLQSESLGAYKQLQLFGVSEDQIARKTNSAKGRIHTALKVADSGPAVAAMEQNELTLDQAAILVEFETDDTALAALQEVAQERPDQLEHEAERIREARLDEEAMARVEQQIRDLGYDVVTDTSGKNIANIAELWRADNPTQSRLTLDKAQEYAGLCGRVDRNYWADRTDENRGYTISWYIRDFQDKGLTTYGIRQPATDTEKEARRQKRQDKADMRAATTVRRAWIRDVLLERGRQLPSVPGAMDWIARELWHATGTLRPGYGNEHHVILEELLGIEPHLESGYDELGNYQTGYNLQIDQLISDSNNHFRLALAVAIGNTESVVGNEKGDAFGQDIRAVHYLRQLEAWGYTLADVEQRIIAAADAKTK